MRLTRQPGAGRISVVIPAYNAGAYLAMTLRSVFAQSAPPCEVIVVDDGSTDDTVAVARSLGAKVISLENRGPSAARNAGTHAAAGEYVAYLDADDLWAPEKLALQFAALAAHPAPAFSFTDFRRFDTFGFHVAPSGLRSHPAFRRVVGKARNRSTILIVAGADRPVLTDMYFLPSSVLVRRSDVLAVGGFDETLRAGEDYEFFLRLFANIPAIAVMLPLLAYRRHPSQLSASPIAISMQEFKIQRLVAAAPARYGISDARYILGKGSLLHFRIGVCNARLGNFEQSIDNFRSSLAERVTLRAAVGFLASRAGQCSAGRRVFHAVRALRRLQREQRVAFAPRGSSTLGSDPEIVLQMALLARTVSG